MFVKILSYAKLTPEQKVSVLLAVIIIYLYSENMALKGIVRTSQEICSNDKKELRKECDEFKLEQTREYREIDRELRELYRKNMILTKKIDENEGN